MIHCHEKLRKAYWNGAVWLIVLCLVLIVLGVVVSSIFGNSWFQLIGIIPCMIVVALRVLRFQALICQQPCGECGKVAGKSLIRNNRLMLICEHCDAETRTDCGFLCQGGPPILLPQKQQSEQAAAPDG